jgi:hypothetical protein
MAVNKPKAIKLKLIKVLGLRDYIFSATFEKL